MKEILVEKRIENILQYLDNPEFLNEQVEGIKQSRKTRARGNLGRGFFSLATGVIVLLLLLSSYQTLVSIATQETGAGRYGASLILGGGALLIPLFIGWGVYFLFSGFIGFARASQKTSLTLATDIDGLCKDFYFTVFCKKPDLDQTQSKVKQILKVCHFIPLPVLQSYEKTGWDTYLEKPKPKLKPEAIHPMTCLLCGKKVEHVETALFPEEGTKVFGATVIIDVRKDEEVEEKKPFIKSAFLKCQQCGAVVCYECMGYGVPKTQRFLCPTCGMATNGWTGLANRWLRLRNSMIDEKYLFKDLSLSSIRVDKTPRSDQRVVDIVVHLTGEHFGEVSFYNIAFSAKGKWFLASPEPILA